MEKPHLIKFPGLGEPDAELSYAAERVTGVPFPIKRVFWTYRTPEEIVRGRHAHHNTEQVLIALAGRIVVFTEMPDGDIQTFVLDQPNLGVYIPPCCWHTMQYYHASIQMVLASTAYNEQDYIRNYDDFKRIWCMPT